MFRRIRPIVIKEYRQLKRDKRSLGVLLFIPAMMLILFGYALTFDVKHISLAVYDEDRTHLSRDFAESFLHSEYFSLKTSLARTSEIDALLGREEASVALVIPNNFSEEILAGRQGKVQVIVDGANSNAATTALGYVNAIVQSYSQEVLTKTLQRVGVHRVVLPIDYRPRVWFNPELRSAKFLIPGLIGFILMVTAVISTSLSIVREKERGTMEQIVVSPVKPMELILGKTILYVIISLLATVVILLVGYFLFEVETRGSYFLLFLVSLVYLVGTLGLGILISTIADSQQVAFTLSVIITMLPTFLLSGFVFPIRNMPIPIQVITYIIPARYYMEALRSIILKGVGMEAFWSQFLALTAFAAVMITVSSKRMKRTLI